MRLFGVEMNNKGFIIFELKKIFGIGKGFINNLIRKYELSNIRVNKLTKENIENIGKDINKIEIEQSLRDRIKDSIDRLIRIGSYRGIRHIKRLPCRGQRTRTNSKTVRKVNRIYE